MSALWSALTLPNPTFPTTVWGAATTVSNATAAPDPLPVDEWNARGNDRGEAVLLGRAPVDEAAFERDHTNRGTWDPSAINVSVPFVGRGWQPGEPVRAVWHTTLPLDRAGAWCQALTSRPEREADASVEPLQDETFRKWFPGLRLASGAVLLRITPRSQILPQSGTNWTDWAVVASLGVVLGVGDCPKLLRAVGRSPPRTIVTSARTRFRR